MKNKELFGLLEVFNQVTSNKTYKGIDFGYFVIKNKKLIESQIEIFKELIKPSEGYTLFQEERLQLLVVVATDSEGTVHKREIGQGNVEYLIQDDKRDHFTKVIDELKIKYNDSLNEYEKQIREYEALLEKNVDIELCRINRLVLPQDITVEHLNVMFDLVD